MITKFTKQYLYKISNIILKWSLVYMIVLFFLEDLKPFLVSTVFSPHWILLILVFSLVSVLVFAQYGHGEIENTHLIKKLNCSQFLYKFDIWLFRLIIFGFILLWLSAIWSILGVWGLLILIILAWLAEKMLINLFPKN